MIPGQRVVARGISVQGTKLLQRYRVPLVLKSPPRLKMEDAHKYRREVFASARRAREGSDPREFEYIECDLDQDELHFDVEPGFPSDTSPGTGLSFCDCTLSDDLGTRYRSNERRACMFRDGNALRRGIQSLGDRISDRASAITIEFKPRLPMLRSEEFVRRLCIDLCTGRATVEG